VRGPCPPIPFILDACGDSILKIAAAAAAAENQRVEKTRRHFHIHAAAAAVVLVVDDVDLFMARTDRHDLPRAKVTVPS